MAQRRGFCASVRGADDHLARIQKLLRGETTFVALDHGFGPQFAAVDGDSVRVELGLLSKPQTANRRPATGETIGRAKACGAGGAVQIYLNLEGRDPARAG